MGREVEVSPFIKENVEETWLRSEVHAASVRRVQRFDVVADQSGVLSPGGDDLAARVAWHHGKVSARIPAGKAGFYSFFDSSPGIRLTISARRGFSPRFGLPSRRSANPARSPCPSPKPTVTFPGSSPTGSGDPSNGGVSVMAAPS